MRREKEKGKWSVRDGQRERGRERVREKRTEKKDLVAGTTCIYTGGYIRTRRKTKREKEKESEVRCRRDMPATTSGFDRVWPVPLFGFQIQHRIQGIFLGVSTQPVSVSDPRMTRQCTGRTQSARLPNDPTEKKELLSVSVAEGFHWSRVCECLCI